MNDEEFNSIDSNGAAELQKNMEGKANTKELAKRRHDQEIMRNSILTQVMDQKALSRLSNLAAAKPDRAQSVENMIIQMARMGQIRNKMSDEELRKLLDTISERTNKTTTVKFDRRRVNIDSDDE